VLGVSLIYFLQKTLMPKAGLGTFRIFQPPAVRPVLTLVDFHEATNAGKKTGHLSEEFRRRAA